MRRPDRIPVGTKKDSANMDHLDSLLLDRYQILAKLREVLAGPDPALRARELFDQLTAEEFPPRLRARLQRLRAAIARLEQPGGAHDAAAAAWSLNIAMLSLSGRCMHAAP